MKKIIAFTMVMALLLAGCGAKESAPETVTVPAITEAAETAASTAAETSQAATQAAETEAAEAYYNPLTGEAVDKPFDRRVFGFSIGNTKEALPHGGISKSDILFESFVNGLTTRRFAMFSDVQNVKAIGGIRSMRVQWTDLCQAYDAVAVHAAGSDYVLGDLKTSKVDNIYGEQWGADFHYRDQERLDAGVALEHTLYNRGADLVKYAESKGVRVTQDPAQDYGMHFSATPDSVNGENASEITITFKLSDRAKPTIMTYDEAAGAYTMNQYGMDMADYVYDNAPELYKNVFALEMKYHGEYNVYHVPETVGEGNGYFACDGKIIPIKWHRESDVSPFTFTLTDGTPLVQGIGNSYMALIPTGSTVEW